MRVWLINNARIKRVLGGFLLEVHSDERMDLAEFSELVADKIEHYKGLQKRILMFLGDRGVNEITIASVEYPLRLGVGSLHVEGDCIILIRRDAGASREPNAYDVAAGVFDDRWVDPLQALFGEAVEVLRTKNDFVFYLISDVISHYEDSIKEEYGRVSRLVAKKNKLFPLPTTIVSIKDGFFLRYNTRDYNTSGLIAIEPHNGSLEYILILNIPTEDYVYWDGELLKEKIPLNREIHKINIKTGEIEVWRRGSIIAKMNLEKIVRSNIGFTSKSKTAISKLAQIYKTDVLKKLKEIALKT